MYRIYKPNGCIGHFNSIKLLDICAFQIATSLEGDADWKTRLASIRAIISTDCYQIIISYLAKTLGMLSAITDSQPTVSNICCKQGETLVTNDHYIKTASYTSPLLPQPTFEIKGITPDGNCVVFEENTHQLDQIVYYQMADKFAIKHVLHCKKVVPQQRVLTSVLSGNYLIATSRNRMIIWKYTDSWQCVSDVRSAYVGIISNRIVARWKLIPVNAAGIAGISSSGWFDKLVFVNPPFRTGADFLPYYCHFALSPSQQRIIMPLYRYPRETGPLSLMICDWDGNVYHVLEDIRCDDICWKLEDRIVVCEAGSNGIQRTNIFDNTDGSTLRKSWYPTGLVYRTTADNTGRYMWLSSYNCSCLHDTMLDTYDKLEGIISVVYLYDYWFVAFGRQFTLRRSTDRSRMHIQIKKQLKIIPECDMVICLIKADTKAIRVMPWPFAGPYTCSLEAPVLIVGDAVFDGAEYMKTFSD